MMSRLNFMPMATAAVIERCSSAPIWHGIAAQNKRAEFQSTQTNSPAMKNPAMFNLDNRKALLFALTAERLSVFYEHGQSLTDAQGASLAALWLARSKIQLALAERQIFSRLSHDLARELAESLSREAGLYTVHEMMEANPQSGLALDLLEECERRLRDAGCVGD